MKTERQKREYRNLHTKIKKQLNEIGRDVIKEVYLCTEEQAVFQHVFDCKKCSHAAFIVEWLRKFYDKKCYILYSDPVNTIDRTYICLIKENESLSENMKAITNI